MPRNMLPYMNILFSNCLIYSLPLSYITSPNTTNKVIIKMSNRHKQWTPWDKFTANIEEKPNYHILYTTSQIVTINKHNIVKEKYDVGSAKMI